MGIEYHGRFVPLRVSHIGVDIKEIEKALNDKVIQNKIKEFKDKLLDKTKSRTLIFSSVDRNHVISGLKNKLLAYLKCLDKYPMMKNKVCLVQYSGPHECPVCLKSQCLHEDKNYQQIMDIV